MPGIEFVDDDGPPAQDGANGLAAAGAERPARPQVASAALLVVAAGLLVAASFATVYRLSYVSHDDGNVQDETVDGWGRVAFRVRSGIEGQHTTRFGIALCAVAGVLVLVALVDGWPRLLGVWHARARRRTPGVALVALGIAAGVLGSATLELQAQRDNARAFSDGDIRLRQAAGAFFWLGPCALLAGACALAVPAVVRARRRSTGPPTEQPDRTEQPEQPGDAVVPAPQADLAHG